MGFCGSEAAFGAPKTIFGGSATILGTPTGLFAGAMEGAAAGFADCPKVNEIGAACFLGGSVMPTLNEKTGRLSASAG